MKVTWRSQEVSISNNYVAVAWNCLGSGRPSVLGSGHLPQDHVLFSLTNHKTMGKDQTYRSIFIYVVHLFKLTIKHQEE